MNREITCKFGLYLEIGRTNQI